MNYNYSIKKAVVSLICEESRNPVSNKTSRVLTGDYISHFLEGISENENGMSHFQSVIKYKLVNIFIFKLWINS